MHPEISKLMRTLTYNGSDGHAPVSGPGCPVLPLDTGRQPRVREWT